MATQNQQNKCYAAALKMLIRREHSQLELSKKLKLKGFKDTDIKKSINLLIEQSYQSDERFSEAFILMRYNQGKGPVIISSELKKRGIENFNLSIFDWFELAKEVREKNRRNQDDHPDEGGFSGLLPLKIVLRLRVWLFLRGLLLLFFLLLFCHAKWS